LRLTAWTGVVSIRPKGTLKYISKRQINQVIMKFVEKCDLASQASSVQVCPN